MKPLIKAGDKVKLTPDGLGFLKNHNINLNGNILTVAELNVVPIKNCKYVLNFKSQECGDLNIPIWMAEYSAA